MSMCDFCEYFDLCPREDGGQCIMTEREHRRPDDGDYDENDGEEDGE